MRAVLVLPVPGACSSMGVSGPHANSRMGMGTRVVGEDGLSGQDMAADGGGQRLQQCRRFADP